MNEHAKNILGSAVSGTGFVGAITLEAANRWAALGCSILGGLAAVLTIANIIRGWRNKK